MQNRKLSAAVFLAVTSVAGAWLASNIRAADPDSITVKVDEPGAKFSPLFYGLMTEEINHAYDGGLYAELIQNRIFRNPPPRRRGLAQVDPANPPHWSVVKSDGADGSFIVDKENPVNTTALTSSLRLDSQGAGGTIGVANDGFWGIPVKPNTQYKASFYARGSDSMKGPLKLAIVSNDDATEYATATIPEIGKEWKKYTATLKTGDVKETADTQFVISTAGDKTGSVWFSLVSLFPPTYHDQPNGFRIDLMEKLAELKPTFLRFPGGNYLEGPDYEDRFNWKATIGPLEERPGHQCPWGYRSSDGLGLLEFLMWCEDLKMEPVLAVYAGLHIDGGRNIITGDELKPHVQDALDEIEYVTGDTGTTWGARRAKDGHPEPFKLTYVEIGNEDNLNNGGRTYDGRFGMFYDAIKEKYPKLQIISTIPPSLRSQRLTDLSRQPDVVDDHLYSQTAGMLRNTTRHNNASRNGPKIFMGEWASNGSGQGIPTPNLKSALSDAAFLGGLERNCDLIVMQCYAPLMVNVNPNARQWQTNLIGYDALHSFGSASFYAQKMYSNNRGDCMLPVEVNAFPAEPAAQPGTVAESLLPKGRVGVGTWSTHAEFKDMKVTVGDKVVYSVDPATAAKDWKFGQGKWNWDGDVLRQTSDDQNCRALVGDPEWTDFTYTLKARKLSGPEGFLILFHAKDGRNWVWWNVGGWGDTRTAIQRAEDGDDRELGRTQNVVVKDQQWYDVKIEVEGRQIRCYLDGQLVAERVDQSPLTPALVYANAVRDGATGEVILRVVNAEGMPRSIAVNLAGTKEVGKQAQVETLTGEPIDTNSVDNPLKVSPQKSTIDNVAANFVHEFPANSVSIIRIKAK
jgi:alpha-L-arabinofuranosidase